MRSHCVAVSLVSLIACALSSACCSWLPSAILTVASFFSTPTKTEALTAAVLASPAALSLGTAAVAPLTAKFKSPTELSYLLPEAIFSALPALSLAVLAIFTSEVKSLSTAPTLAPRAMSALAFFFMSLLSPVFFAAPSAALSTFFSSSLLTSPTIFSASSLVISIASPAETISVPSGKTVYFTALFTAIVSEVFVSPVTAIFLPAEISPSIFTWLLLSTKLKPKAVLASPATVLSVSSLVLLLIALATSFMRSSTLAAIFTEPCSAVILAFFLTLIVALSCKSLIATPSFIPLFCAWVSPSAAFFVASFTAAEVIFVPSILAFKITSPCFEVSCAPSAILIVAALSVEL